jgi:hypothetical protein
MKAVFEKIEVNDLKVIKKLADIQSDVILRKQLLLNEKCVVRLYMIDGKNMA